MTERKQHHDIYETIQITPDAPYPGNDLPVRLYRQALSGSRDTLITGFKRLFTSHGWSEPWINGIYDFHHFHAEAHEVLGCAAGRVTVQLGGPNGPKLTLQAGDAVLLPAGVTHKRLEASADYRILGSYPHDQEPDLRKGDPKEWEVVTTAIQDVQIWDQDPVTGTRT